ncbi:hypothetical protein EZS27_019650 [termite gut metagenome]|uniref:Uncharacterized protein n=1 Tax=termite gut metagenome TaxID=433724 RepID=A0A5J4RDL2_9ZZZZ
MNEKEIDIVYEFTCEDVFECVKRESSLLAERRNDTEGLFEKLVFDEEYKNYGVFEEYFFDARAEIIPVVSAYVNPKEDVPGQKDFFVRLLMPCDFMEAMKEVIGIKIKQFLIAYIMYRWLETKLSQEAAVYYQRATNLLPQIKGYLEKRDRPYKRPVRWF